jgi:hypothetical protein
MHQTYRLLLYITVSDNLALIDTLFCDDRDELLAQAMGRTSNNPEYKAVLLSYSLTGAEIVNGETAHGPTNT